MSQEDVEKFRNALEAFNRGDIQGALKDMDPKVEWRTPQNLPDAQTYHGHDGVKAWWAMWNDAFADLRLEPGEFKDLGEGRLGEGRVLVFGPSIGKR
jgi:ketosteroid isomerase-like protein